MIFLQCMRIQRNSCRDTIRFAQEKGHFGLQAVKEITQKFGREYIILFWVILLFFRHDQLRSNVGEGLFSLEITPWKKNLKEQRQLLRYYFIYCSHFHLMFYGFCIHFAAQVEEKVGSGLFTAEKRYGSWSYSFKISVSLLTKNTTLDLNGHEPEPTFQNWFCLTLACGSRKIPHNTSTSKMKVYEWKLFFPQQLSVCNQFFQLRHKPILHIEIGIQNHW